MKRVHIGHISEIAEKRSRVVRIGDLEIADVQALGRCDQSH